MEPSVDIEKPWLSPIFGRLFPGSQAAAATWRKLARRHPFSILPIRVADYDGGP
jgi:hypothetical protein